MTAAILDLAAELAELGKEAARDAWVEYAGELEAIPTRPEQRAWANVAADRGLIEFPVLTETERRTFVHAYRNELHVLAAGAR